MIELSASVLAADFSELGAQLREAFAAGVLVSTVVVAWAAVPGWRLPARSMATE